MIETTSPQFWRATLALCIASFMVFANLHGMQPLLPLVATSLELSELAVSRTYTIATLVLGFSLLFYGPLSDVVGRRGIIVFTLIGVMLVSVLLFFARDYSSLFWLRAVQGFFLAGVPAVAIAYMGDEFTPKAMMTAVGLYIAGNSLGGVSGRILGGIVGDWLGWPAVFLMLTGLSCCCIALVAWLLPPSQHFKPKAFSLLGMLKDLALHVSNPKLLMAYIIGGLNFFIFLNQYTYITFVLAEPPYALPASILGLLFLTYLTGTAGSMVSGRIAQRFSSPLCMSVGILILMLGTALTLNDSLWAIVLGFFINSFGFFFTHSVASSWVSRHAHTARASASALYLVFYYVGASAGGYYLYPFWQAQGWSGVVLGSMIVFTLTLICSLILLYWQRKETFSH